MSFSLLTVSSEKYRASRERLVASAERYGTATIHSIDLDQVKDDPFFAEHATIMSLPRGAGYWLWKPYLIKKTLDSLTSDGVLVYMDSGVEIVADLSPLVERCRNEAPIMLFANSADSNLRWTKRDAYVLMGCDSPEYWHGPHCDASMSLFRAGPESREFVARWLDHCTRAEILTDAPNVGGKENHPEFRDHRHDQSVLSLLAQQRQIELHRVPSQFGNHYKAYPYRVLGEFNCTGQVDQTQLAHYSTVPFTNSSYGQLTNHHRTQAPVVQWVRDTRLRTIPGRIARRLWRAISRALPSWQPPGGSASPKS